MTYITKVHLYGVRQRGMLRWEVVQEVNDWLDHYCYEQDLIVSFDTEFWEGAVSCRP